MTPQTLHISIRPMLKDTFIGVLYRAEEERAQKELHEIILANIEKTGNERFAFKYLGKVYSTMQKVPLLAVPLHPDLHRRMNDWLANSREVINTEKVLVTGIVTAILNSSPSVRDWLRLLPHELHHYVHQFIGANPTYDFPPVLSDTEVEQFLQKNSKFMSLLKGRIVLNSIM